MEQAKVDIFPLMKEAIKQEPMVLLPVAPEQIDGVRAMFPQLPQGDQMKALRNFWIFGEKGKAKDFSNPDDVIGFVFANKPEDAHVAAINTWVPKRFKGAYTPETIMEVASHAKGYPQSADALHSATKLALAKVFYFEGKKQYGDIQAAAVWVAHNSENMLDSFSAEQMMKLGGRAVGHMKYNDQAAVDSTCFLIPKQAFMNKLTGQEQKFTQASRPKPPLV